VDGVGGKAQSGGAAPALAAKAGTNATASRKERM
jgi:hypothetical protein